jgi:hypothetical protein
MMKLREALILQSPSLALQRAAADEIARQDAFIYDLTNALLDVLDGEKPHDLPLITGLPQGDCDRIERVWNEAKKFLHTT